MNEREIEIIDGIFKKKILEAFFIVYFVCVGNLQFLSSTGNFVCVLIYLLNMQSLGHFFFYLFFHFFYGASINDKDDHFTKTCIEIG